MEPKKNPKYDVHAQRGTIFQISLVITLAMVISAFQWSSPVEKEPVTDPGPHQVYHPIEYLIPSTSIKTPEPPTVPKIKPLKPNPTEYIVSNSPKANEKSAMLPIDQVIPVDNSSLYGSIEIPVDSSETIFCIVEKMPEPIGGYKGFYEGLSANLKYPKRASRDNVTGKVFISFVVNEKSELSDFKILKGIGYGCDEEAIRVIALSKWNAGKQRGRPVKVRMVQTINFQLN